MFIESSKPPEEYTKPCSTNESDTWVFPSIQMGISNIHQDELLTSKFIENTGKETLQNSLILLLCDT